MSGQKSGETAFLKEISAHPEDVAARLVYADWLEEQGDPRSEEIRAACRYRLPISIEERRHLAHIAAARSVADGGVVLQGDTLTNSSWQVLDENALADHLAAYSAAMIEQNFPRDRSGQFALGTVVLLAAHPCANPLPRGRDLWLAAKGPVRRKDPQRITLDLEPLIERNAQHHWAGSPWLWRNDGASQNPFADLPQPTWDVVGGDAHQPLDRLQAAFAAAYGAEQWMFVLCTLLQDAGRFEDAFRVCGVGFPSELTRLLNAETFALEGGCDCMFGEAAEPRAAHLREHLWEAAPWRFWAALAAGHGGKLLILPRQRHARKASLMLAWPPEKPALVLDFTASNARAPDTAWKRPVEIDLARFGHTP